MKALGLIIEIDGESHNTKEEYDEKREVFLISLGLKLFKTSNHKILHDTDNVMKDLEQFIIDSFGVKK
ncbi:hypothetical protein FSS13T_27020 [Flavobacterium saliperosum S13]|uniref:DUF559 domain-containing protein n=1 Tax=Flavobacterium saliperosum S13 TaxID=1341155 RepID=A0ABN0QDG4_9FLAO|nr:hypothetical protein FSS13T_27020 [Flavobacterium saliperosum S13]